MGVMRNEKMVQWTFPTPIRASSLHPGLRVATLVWYSTPYGDFVTSASMSTTNQPNGSVVSIGGGWLRGAFVASHAQSTCVFWL